MLVNNSSNVSIFNCGSESNLFQYRIIVEKLNDELSKFGLTSNQINVFLFLSKYGESSASNISNSLTMPRTETYQILNSLQNKGIINSKLCHPTKFSALPLNNALSLLINAEKTRITTLENNETKLENLWKKIPQFDPSTNTVDDNLQMLKGSNVIFAKISEIFNSKPSNLKIFCNEKNFSRLYREGFFDNLDSSRLKLVVTSKSKESLPSKHNYISKNSLIYKKIESNQCFIIKDSSEILFFIRNMEYSKKQIFAFTTTSKSLIQSLNLLFDNIWEKETINSKSSNVYQSKLKKIMSKFDNIENEIDVNYSIGLLQKPEMLA